MLEWMKRKLVKDAKKWYTWASSWVFIAIPFIIALQETIPFVQEMLPSWVVAVVSILGLFARIYKQGKDGDDNDDHK